MAIAAFSYLSFMVQKHSALQFLRQGIQDILSLIYPPFCIHCGRPLVGDEKSLCTHCLFDITWARHASYPNNEVEMRLSGQIPFKSASSLMFFSKDSVAQSIVHQIKYYGNTQLGIQYGQLLGFELLKSGRFNDIDYLVPVPLHWWRKMRRGYNQSYLICKGISRAIDVPIVSHNLYRRRYTQTQTHKNRIERLDNMQSVFAVHRPKQFKDKHILLVDDIITTGATTNSCYQALASIPGLTISVACLGIVQR